MEQLENNIISSPGIQGNENIEKSKINTKRKRIKIPYETKVKVYRAYKHDKKSIDDIVEEFGINKKTVYAISHKLSNEEEIQNIKTESSNQEQNNKSVVSIDEKEKPSTINEILTNNKIEDENKKEDINNESNSHDNEDLINFLNKNKEEEIINDEKEEPKTINLEPLKLKHSLTINEDPIITNKFIKTQHIINNDDLELITNNKIDVSDNDKNNYIIKIRKYYNYFEDQVKHIIPKTKINSLFKLKTDELKSIYDLLRLEINSTSSLNFENIADMTLSNIEKVSRLININLDGLRDDLFMNEIFIKNLKICEIEHGEFLNFMTPKKMIMLMFIKSAYTRYNINKVNDKLNDKLNIPLSEDLKKKYEKL